MFGSKKLKEAESQLSTLKDQLNQVTAQRDGLTQQLADAQSRIADLEARLNDFDLERLKEEARTSRAEYEGLKELYRQKNDSFDQAKEDEEQNFAREQAIKRYNLENEIRDNRQANQDYVVETVKTFGESYNYYLNQIKLLMDALGDVASRTGEALFSAENADLKARFGSQMRDSLKSGMGALGTGNEEFIVLTAEDKAAHEEEVEEEVVEEAEEIFEEAEEAVEEAVEEAEEAVEEAVEEVVEEAEEAVEEVVEEVEEAAEEDSAEVFE